MPVAHYLVLSFILFLIGTAGVLLRRNTLIVLMGIELQLNGGNLALLAFARQLNDQKDHVIAFLVASPVPARQGWLVEQFVRSHAAVNGTTNLMVDAAMRAFAHGGAEFVTLGLAPLSAHGPDVRLPGEPLWLRFVLGWVRLHGRRFYNFAGLDQFKARLRPERWDPVYAIAGAPRFSPRMLYAIAGAFSGGSPVLLVARGIGRAVAWELTGKPWRRGGA